MRKPIWFVLVVLVVAFGFMGCTERVPPGFVGMVQKPSGIEEVVLAPGNHTCWNRDRMILFETKEVTTTENLSVLCADNLNFKFDLKVRSRLFSVKAKKLAEVAMRQGANIKWKQSVGVLPFASLYTTYLKPVARSIARTHVSKLETTEIRGKREELQKVIQKELIKAASGTPLEVVMAVTSNFDYPEIVTLAVEKAKSRQMQIEEEKANQAMELLKADNRMKIAAKMVAVRAKEAEAEAVYIRVLGEALTPLYVDLRQVEARATLYSKAGPGDKVVVTEGGNASPFVTSVARPAAKPSQ